MRNRIQHNYPSLIQCLRAFHILCFAYLLFRCYCYNYYTTAIFTFCHCYHYYHITLLLNTLLQILSYPGVVELTTQLLILENILWHPFRWINKFGLNTLPSKTIAIPYTCGLSVRPPNIIHRLQQCSRIWGSVARSLDGSLYGHPTPGSARGFEPRNILDKWRLWCQGSENGSLAQRRPKNASSVRRTRIPPCSPG